MIGVGDLVEVIVEQVEGGPPVGARLRVLEDDGTSVPYRVDWGAGGWWLSADEIRPTATDEKMGGCALALSHNKYHLLGDPRGQLRALGWMPRQHFEVGETVEAWAYSYMDGGPPLIVEIGHGNINAHGFVDSDSIANFTSTELRLFADLADQAGAEQ